MNNSLKKKKLLLITISCILVLGLMSCATQKSQGPGYGNGQQIGGPNQAPQMVELDFESAALVLNITEEELQTAFSSTTQGPPNFEAIAEELGVSLEDLLAAFGIDNIQMQGPGAGQGPGPRN